MTTQTNPNPLITAARDIAAHISIGSPITRDTLNQAMERAFGETNASGSWTQRSSFEALEAATVMSATKMIVDNSAEQTIKALRALEQSLPTQTVRSEEQLELQQFSTPPSIAFLAAHLALATHADRVLEPSAGTGLLAAMMRHPQSNLVLNEVDPARAAILEALFPEATLYRHDASKLSSLLPTSERPTVIVMNPPFSNSITRGEDRNTAARHLKAAIDYISPGGRIVAIMPDWFSTNSANDKVIAHTLEHASVKLSLRLEKGAYAKHGTNIAVRILVIDKAPRTSTPATINRASALDLYKAITTIPARAALRDPASTLTPRTKPAGLFRAIKSQPTRTIVIRKPQSNAVKPVEYLALPEPAPMGEQHGVYTAYRPSRLRIVKAGEHPTQLVESSAMASIAAPMAKYIPTLPERTVDELQLSEAQLETVIYAGEAWSRDLHGRFSLDDKSVALNEDPEGKLYRTGFFLGDGTGAGKGRQAAACILDQWVRGSRKHIWISKNAPLFEDAKRDWTALGGLPADLLDISTWKINQQITSPEGILFVPYGTLRSARVEDTRLRQILQWANDDFEGVIVFDEAHEMGGVAGGEGTMGKKDGSLQGIAGVMLQNHLPRARVLYASATGASDVNNLAYAVRLGLWGPGTSFADREQFITEIRDGGIAAMELVARDLKASGLYLSRALSFAGIEYDILKHDLSIEQIEIYDTYSEAWSIIHQNLEEVLEITGVVDPLENKTLNSQAKAAARSRFESCKQRFFSQVLLSFKLPSVIPAIDEHITEGDSVVVQLVSTAESILDRRLNQLDPEEREDLDIDLSPRESVIDYLTRAFPTRQMQEYTDELGETHSRPMFDEDGHPIHNPEAIARREAMIEHICALPPIPTALDAIIANYGPSKVAEVTGRSKRLVLDPNNQQRLETRSPRTNLAETSAFMTGAKRILVFSDAGGTGRSYHASLDAANQQRRVHFLLEPGWRADRAIQGLGRTHRTHQACPPLFRPVTTDCKGEARFTSTIARRLDSLGALTRGQRQTGGQGMFDASDNLESVYAKHALHDWYCLLADGKLKSISLKTFERISGLSLTDKDGVLKEELPPIQRWLNRILALKIATQNSIFDEFLTLIETRVSAAKERGTYDIGVETVQVEQCATLSDTTIRTDQITGATTHLLELTLKRRRRLITPERIMANLDAIHHAEPVQNDKSGLPALRIEAHSHMDDEGNFIRRYELIRPGRSDYMLATTYQESAWKPIARTKFEALWREEYDREKDQLVSETIYLATGLLLPVWGALPKESLAVIRIVDAEGTSWLGRQIHDIHVDSTLSKLGVERSGNLNTDVLIDAIITGADYQAPHPKNFRIKTSRVNGERRIEIVGAAAASIPDLKAKGCFTEIIQWKTRVFIPREKARDILGVLLR